MRKDVSEILDMPDRRVRFWRAYLDRVPDLEERMGFYLCQVSSLLFNINRDKSTSQSMKASDLDPWHDPWGETRLTVDEQRALIHRTLDPDPSPE